MWVVEETARGSCVPIVWNLMSVSGPEESPAESTPSSASSAQASCLPAPAATAAWPPPPRPASSAMVGGVSRRTASVRLMGTEVFALVRPRPCPRKKRPFAPPPFLFTPLPRRLLPAAPAPTPPPPVLAAYANVVTFQTPGFVCVYASSSVLGRAQFWT